MDKTTVTNISSSSLPMPRQYRWRFLAPGQRAVVEGTVDEVVAIFGMLGGVAGLLRFEPAPSRRWSRT